MSSIIDFLTALCASLVNAAAIFFLWGWFIVPLGVPAVGFWHAYGLGLCMYFVLLPIIFCIRESSMLAQDDVFVVSVYSIVSALVIVTTGYLIQSGL